MSSFETSAGLVRDWNIGEIFVDSGFQILIDISSVCHCSIRRSRMGYMPTYQVFHCLFQRFDLYMSSFALRGPFRFPLRRLPRTKAFSRRSRHSREGVCNYIGWSGRKQKKSLELLYMYPHDCVCGQNFSGYLLLFMYQDTPDEKSMHSVRSDIMMTTL